MISGWKRTPIENIATGFERGKSDEARATEAEIEKLHSKFRASKGRNSPVVTGSRCWKMPKSKFLWTAKVVGSTIA